MKKKKIRSFDEEFKRAAVARLHQGEAAVRIAFDLEIPRKLLYDWKRRVEQGKRLGGLGRPAQPKPTASPGDHIAYLERLVGQLTAENHFFHSALRKLGMRKANDPGNEPSASTSANTCGPAEA